MYLNLKQLFEKYKSKRAIGAFNLHCMEMFPYIVEGARRANAPVIIQTSQGTAEYLGVDWIVKTAKLFAKDVDLCLHMDHCKDIDFIHYAIDRGYSSIMYDGSSLDIKTNISNTIKVVEYAREFNVSVEGEIGSIGGSEDGVGNINTVNYTKVEDAIEFVNKTDVDALAVAIGTAHGQYKGEARINFDLLEDIIKELDNVGLVLHGGTGVKDENFKRCAKVGMMKFNVGTELNKGYIDNINASFKNAKPTTSLRSLLNEANKAIVKIVEERSRLLEL